MIEPPAPASPRCVKTPSPTHAFFALPNAVQARILTYLLPEDLDALGASGGYWTGVEGDEELRRIWTRRVGLELGRKVETPC